MIVKVTKTIKNVFSSSYHFSYVVRECTEDTTVSPGTDNPDISTETAGTPTTTLLNTPSCTIDMDCAYGKFCNGGICVVETTISTWTVNSTDPIGSSPYIPTTSPGQICERDWDCEYTQICEDGKCVNEATTPHETDKTTSFTEDYGTGRTTEIPTTSCQTENDCNDGDICLEGSCERKLDGIFITRDIIIHCVPDIIIIKKNILT